jgi:pimeloyl-ACP methyl ester carboxylesterase
MSRAALAFTDSGPAGRGPAVVLLHGLGSDRSRWAPVVARLPDVRCIAVDLPGHGGSPPVGCNALHASAALHRLVDELALGDPVVVGHSLGGVVALLYGAAFPARAIAAIDPVPLHLPALVDSLAPFRDRLLAGGAATTAAFWEWEQRYRPDAYGAPIRDGLRPTPDVIVAYWRTLLDPEADVTLLGAPLAAIPVPVLLLLATRPSAEDEPLIRGIPRVSTECWDPLGHWMHLVDPDRFTRRLRAFVEATTCPP